MIAFVIAVIVAGSHQVVTPTQIEAAPCHAEPTGAKPGQGCFVLGRQSLGALSRSSTLYWHIDVFDSVKAADSAKTAHSMVVVSHGKVWLFTIADFGWSVRGGHHVGRIGPLPLVAARSYAVEYVEGDFPPGMMTRVHRHPGAEAFYTVAGQTCLETPKGVFRQQADGPGVVIPGGMPMRLTAIGSQQRFGFAAVIQDASKPFSSPAYDWHPRGLCHSLGNLSFDERLVGFDQDMPFARRLDPTGRDERRVISVEPEDDTGTVHRRIVLAVEVVAVDADGFRKRTVGRARHRRVR